MNNLEKRAWQLYCDETKGDMDTKDFWSQLSPKVQRIYLDKVKLIDYVAR